MVVLLLSAVQHEVGAILSKLNMQLAPKQLTDKFAQVRC